MVKKKYQKIRGICEKVLSADKIEIYNVNIDYLENPNIEKRRGQFINCLRDGQPADFAGREVFGCDVFGFSLFDIYMICYDYAIQEIELLIEPTSPLWEPIQDALSAFINTQYNPIKSGNSKFIEFINNRQNKLSKILETLDKSK
jgi:hypothetical protein